MEVIVNSNITPENPNPILEEKKQLSANKRKKLKYFKIYMFKIKPLGNLFSKIIFKKEYQNFKKTQKKNLLPGVGVGIFLIDSVKNRLLLGKRRESGFFGLPGGWLELGEEWEDCAARELQEETGLIKANNTFSHVYTLNCRKVEHSYHNISCIMMNEISELEVNKIFNPEPHKCYGWFWTSVDLLRKNLDRLFYPLQDFLRKFPQIQTTNDIKNLVKNYKGDKEKDIN